MNKPEMKSALIDLHYLPSIEYFCALRKYDEIVFEKYEHFEKQSYRNRCYINTSNGVQLLSVPLTEKHGKVLIKDVQIDYTKSWQNNHWRTIESAYRSAPFFEHYSEAIQNAIYKNHVYLYDLNIELLSFCLQSLKWDLKRTESVTYEKEPSGCFDLRSKISAKKPASERPYYQGIPYQQVFGNHFAENLSLIDLLFCQGPQSHFLISQSTKEIEQIKSK